MKLDGGDRSSSINNSSVNNDQVYTTCTGGRCKQLCRRQRQPRSSSDAVASNVTAALARFSVQHPPRPPVRPSAHPSPVCLSADTLFTNGKSKQLVPAVSYDGAANNLSTRSSRYYGKYWPSVQLTTPIAAVCRSLRLLHDDSNSINVGGFDSDL